MSSSSYTQSTGLTALRLLFFFSCRKHLPRNIPLTVVDPVVYDGDPLPTPLSASTSKPDWRLSLARTVFSWTFAECSTLFLLLMLQAINVFDPLTRLYNFQFSLYVLLMLIVLVIPSCFALSLSSSIPGPLTLSSQPTFTLKTLLTSPRAILTAVLPTALSLFLLSYVPIPTSYSFNNNSFLTITLTRLIALGTAILGLLSGFGAVTRAWDFLPSLPCIRRNEIESIAPPTEEEIHAAESSLESVRRDISELRRRRDDIEMQNLGLAEDNIGSNRSGEGSNWLRRVENSLRGGDSVSLELKGFEALEQHISGTLSSLHSRRSTARFHRTFRGRLWALLGKTFAIYCVLRVVSAIYNLICQYLRPQSKSTGSSYPDMIANILIWFLIPLTSSDGITGMDSPSDLPYHHILSVTINERTIAAFTRQMSLVLVGLIVLSSVGVVLRAVNRALRVTSRKLGTALVLMLLAQLMGIYLLSTIVQLRSSFPPVPMPSSSPNSSLAPSSSSTPDSVPSPSYPLPTISDTNNTSTDTNLFSVIPAYTLFGSLFDSSFLLAAASTALGMWAKEIVGMVNNT